MTPIADFRPTTCVATWRTCAAGTMPNASANAFACCDACALGVPFGEQSVDEHAVGPFQPGADRARSSASARAVSAPLSVAGRPSAWPSAATRRKSSTAMTLSVVRAAVLMS